MEPTKSSSVFLSKYFHILHLCVSLGLVIAVVHNQLTNNTRFDKLESQVTLQGKSNRNVDGSSTIESSLEARHFILKRDALVKSQQRIKMNSTTFKNKFQNVTSLRQDKKKDVVTCLDMLRTFVKDITGKSTSNMNVCKQFRGPPGKPGIRGQRGRKGKRGAKGLPGQKGSMGKHGPPGPRGEKGFSGNVTVIGLKGDVGPRGDKGNEGMEGQQGIKGSKGDLGGPKGDRGQRGEKGDTGPRGCSGDSFAAPKFYSSPQSLVFTEKESATLLCNVTANPYAHITWYRNDVQLIDKNRYSIQDNVTVPSVLHSKTIHCNVKKYPYTHSSLAIKRSQASDTGNYFCQARNVMGVFRYQIRLQIQVYVQFTTVPSNITVVEKDNAQLSCRASGVPSPLITWQRKDGRPMPSVFRVVLGDLHITMVTKQDEGVYECVASNVLGSRTTQATIGVNVFPEISQFRKHVTTINESQTLNLPCRATGFPAPVITWHKINDSLPSGRYAYNSQRLTVSDVRYEDRGEYVCMANNILGVVSKRTTVIVQVAPKIIKRPNVIEYGYRGYNTTLIFKVFAFPPALITWKKNGALVKQHKQETTSFTLEKTQHQDSGVYQATAENILGTVTVISFLVVTYPGLRPENAIKNCKTLKADKPSASSGIYWMNPAGEKGTAFQGYCDMETAGGGWTLVYSYTFTNYRNFGSGSNGITPQPDWPSVGNILRSTEVPLSETHYAAMHFNLWKQIGSEFMIKSNINHWIKCTEGTGSLLKWKSGSINCQVVKSVPSKCQNIAPNSIRIYTAPSLDRSSHYYYFEGSTGDWPTHDPCGRNSQNHVKGVANPRGNIYVR